MRGECGIYVVCAMCSLATCKQATSPCGVLCSCSRIKPARRNSCKCSPSISTRSSIAPQLRASTGLAVLRIAKGVGVGVLSRWWGGREGFRTNRHPILLVLFTIPTNALYSSLDPIHFHLKHFLSIAPFIHSIIDYYSFFFLPILTYIPAFSEIY